MSDVPQLHAEVAPLLLKHQTTAFEAPFQIRTEVLPDAVEYRVQPAPGATLHGDTEGVTTPRNPTLELRAIVVRSAGGEGTLSVRIHTWFEQKTATADVEFTNGSGLLRGYRGVVAAWRHGPLLELPGFSIAHAEAR